jgi:DNA-binding transcriptional MerR regulator
MMEDRNQKQRITQYLQGVEVQQRILRDMQRAREEATVTISNAASLFDFSENQLRDWEKTGLLNPLRRAQDAEQDGKGAKRRQYTTTELDKLAIIRELMNAGFSPGGIPTNVDEMWDSVAGHIQQKSRLLEIEHKDEEHVHIDQRIELADQQFFWNFYAYAALRLSLMLIREDVPDTIIGLVLPLQPLIIPIEEVHPDNLKELGPCLIGWLRQNESFYMFLEVEPSFELPSDFRMHPLQAMKDNNALLTHPQNNFFIVVQRKVKPITLDTPAVDTIHRLLFPLDEYKHEWQHFFSQGNHNEVFPATNFNSSVNFVDDTLNRLTDLVIHAGGCSLANGSQSRWRFCCILSPGVSPNNSILPKQQHRLIVRAQSKDSPHEIGKTYVSPDKTESALSIRAYVSGQIVYRPIVVREDGTIAFRDIEGKIGSAIAIPVEGENGLPMAVMYIVSREEEIGAFPENDQRLLRMIGKIVQELLAIYHNRQRVASNIKNIIEKPSVADSIVGKFYSENRFIRDVETLLTTIQKTMPMKGTETGEKDLSFISLDIDKQSNLGRIVGDLATRNLSLKLGERLHVQLAMHFGKLADWHFYYLFAGRFYIMLDNISQEVAGGNAELLREALRGVYEIDALRTTLDQPISPSDVLKLPEITIRLGVTSYKYWKLAALLQRYADTFPIANVRCLITRFLDIALAECDKDSIVAWEIDEKKFKPWPFQTK